MFLRLNHIIYRSYCQLKLINRSSYTFNMEKCFFRKESGNDKFDISFIYKNDGQKINRQFNFVRSTEETLETLLTRMSANVEKIVIKKNKKNSQTCEKPEIKLFVNNLELDKNIMCNELFTMKNLTLKVVDQLYEVVFNVPWVLSISLPTSILSEFPVYPINLKLQFATKEQSEFVWYSGMLKNENGNVIADAHIKWNETGRGITFKPTTQDIGKKLKVECIPGNVKEKGPPVEAISSVVVEAGPGHCPFENRHAFTNYKLSGKSFRVVSYNILADLYCDSDYTRTVLHPYCPPYALHIDYRKQLILKELLGYNADLLCLQEVDKKIFNHELEPILGVFDMDGVFTKKGKEVAEGLACFFNRNRFRLLSSFSLILAEKLKTMCCFKPIWDHIQNNEKLANRILDRSTASQATILSSIDNEDEILLVGNTHLYFHPDADHIRLLQGGMVIFWLREILQQLQIEHPSKRVSIIICGDFNSVPTCGIYQLYTQGVASEDLEDWQSNIEESVCGLTLRQDLPLESACGKPKYTNYTAEFADCLDYIYYNKNHLSVEQVIPFPSEEELKEHTALPSVVFPSDHIALIADLKFR